MNGTITNLFPRDENNHNVSSIHIVLNNAQIEMISEKIAQDLNTVNFDIHQRVAYLKERIAQILRCYRRESIDEACSTISDAEINEMRKHVHRGIRKSVGSLYEKAKLDTNFIRLYDRAEAEETKHNINKMVMHGNLCRFKDRTIDELEKINDRMETLTASVKSAVQDYLAGSNVEVSDKRFSADFEKTDEDTKKLVAQTKNNIDASVSNLLTNSKKKKTKQEIESEKHLLENLILFEKKLKDDLRNQKEELEQTLNNINSKMKNILPSKGSYDAN